MSNWDPHRRHKSGKKCAGALTNSDHDLIWWAWFTSRY